MQAHEHRKTNEIMTEMAGSKRIKRGKIEYVVYLFTASGSYIGNQIDKIMDGQTYTSQLMNWYTTSPSARLGERYRPE